MFLTGSPRLPLGGFEALEPRLTVVQKKPESHKSLVADQLLPSVMTCQNYLKLPDYSSYAILKQKFDQAVSEGANHFGFN
jgi:E3 ubiquitin-protein ligase TRIP12